MAKQFELRLLDGAAPSGQLAVDDLIALAQSLKEVGTKLSRQETQAERTGRPTNRTRQLATLNIGLAPGSTRITVQRTGADENALDFDLDEEQSFDERFEAVIASIATNRRPTWASASLAIAAGNLRTALAHAAPRVEFTVDGAKKLDFSTDDTLPETWLTVDDEPDDSTLVFLGRLRIVNLDTHRLQVTDDVGNKVGLPNVAEDDAAGRLLGKYVEVKGTPTHDVDGRLTHIHGAVIEPAPQLPPGIGVGVQTATDLDEILASAPGPSTDGIAGLTEDEADAFFTAIGV